MMDWFFGLLDHLFQSYIWKEVISHFTWLDWMSAAAFFAGLIYGAQKGLLRTAVQLAETVGIAWVVLYFYPRLEELLQPSFKFLHAGWLGLLCFVLTAILFTFLVSMVDGWLGKLFHTSLSPILRGLGGAVVGACFLLFLWSFFCQALLIFPNRKVRTLFEKKQSITGFYVAQIVPRVVSPGKLKKKGAKA